MSRKKSFWLIFSLFFCDNIVDKNRIMVRNSFLEAEHSTLSPYTFYIYRTIE